MVRKLDESGLTLEQIEKLEKKREKTRERQRKYRLKQDALVPPPIVIPPESPPESAPESDDSIPALKHKIFLLESQLKSTVANQPYIKPAPALITGSKMSKEVALEAFDKLEFNREGSKKQYIANMNTVMKILATDNFGFILHPEKTYKILTDATKLNGEKYSTNSIKQYLQFICWACDNLHLALPAKNKKYFDDKLNIYQIKSNDLDEIKSNEDVAIDFDSLLTSIKNKYNENSREYILTKMYSECPVRDDMGSLVVVPSIASTKDQINYLILPKGHRMTATVLLNQYKNSSKNGQINTILSLPLSQLLRKYQHSKNIYYGDKYFGGGKLSVEIGKMLRSVGFKGSINLLRHSAITQRHQNKELSAEERHKMAQESGHSAPMDKVYIRRNVVRVNPS